MWFQPLLLPAPADPAIGEELPARVVLGRVGGFRKRIFLLFELLGHLVLPPPHIGMAEAFFVHHWFMGH